MYLSFPRKKKKKNDGLVGIKFKNSVTAQEEELILRRYLDDESIEKMDVSQGFFTINDTKTVPKKNHHEWALYWVKSIMKKVYIKCVWK